MARLLRAGLGRSRNYAKAGGRILRLGADPDTVTALHYAEYLADLPDKRRTRWDYVLAGEDGPRHVWITCLDDSAGIALWPGEDYFARDPARPIWPRAATAPARSARRIPN